jgi:hypothetical protein
LTGVPKGNESTFSMVTLSALIEKTALVIESFPANVKDVMRGFVELVTLVSFEFKHADKATATQNKQMNLRK